MNCTRIPWTMNPTTCMGRYVLWCSFCVFACVPAWSSRQDASLRKERYAQEMSYRGQTKNGVREGIGTYEYSNKFFKYTGDWLDGKKHGHGVFYLGDGTVYSGAFIKGEMTGAGSKKWSDGRSYRGPFVLEMDGEDGEWKGADGTEYKGAFYKNTFHGHGTLTTPKKDTYIGDFVRHKKDGLGEMNYANGESYSGEWVQDIRHGQGAYSWPSNVKYSGQWVKGVEEGDGILEDETSGIFLESVWHDGKPSQLPVKLQMSIANLLLEQPSLSLPHSASQKQPPNELLTPVQTPKKLAPSDSKKNSKENLKENSKDSKENLKENTKEPNLPTPKDIPVASPLTTPHLTPPVSSAPVRDSLTGLPLLCIESGAHLPSLSISCHAADPHPFIPLLYIATPTSQHPHVTPLSDPAPQQSRVVEGESGRLVGLVLTQLTAPTPLAKTAKSKSRKVVPNAKLEVTKIEVPKIVEKEVASQPATPSRNPARRSRSVRTPDKMRRSPEPEALEEIKEVEEVLPPPPPVHQLHLEGDERTVLVASILELAVINEINDIVQQIDQLQAKLRNYDPPSTTSQAPPTSSLPQQPTSARPPSPQKQPPSARPSSPSLLKQQAISNRPGSPSQRPSSPLTQQQRPSSPQKPQSPQTKAERQEKAEKDKAEKGEKGEGKPEKQTVQMQRQQQMKQLRQQLDTLQATLLQHVKAQQSAAQLSQGFAVRTQKGQCAFSELVAPPNMESGDYVLSCVDYTPMPPPQSKAAPFIATCSPDSILIRILPSSSSQKDVKATNE